MLFLVSSAFPGSLCMYALQLLPSSVCLLSISFIEILFAYHKIYPCKAYIQWVFLVWVFFF